MNKKMKNQNGLATIFIVLIIVVVVGVAGVVVYNIVSDTHYKLEIETGEITKEFLDSYSSYMDIDDDEIDDIVDIIEKIEISIDVYADGNDVTKIGFSIDYGKALEDLYDYAVENDLEGVDEYDDYDEFVDALYDEFDDEDLNGDTIVESYLDLLEEIDADYDEDELEDLVKFDLDEDKGKLEVSIEVVDEINEYIADYMDENYDDMIDSLEEIADEYDIEIDIDEDTYLEDFIKFAAGSISDYSTLTKNGKKVKVDDWGIDVMDLMTDLMYGSSSILY